MNQILRALMGSITALLLTASVLSAQEAPVSIVGQLDDGISAPAAPTASEVPLPQFRILETKVGQRPEGKLTIHRVADPGLPPPVNKDVAPAAPGGDLSVDAATKM